MSRTLSATEGQNLRRLVTTTSVAVALALALGKLGVYLLSGSVSLLSSLIDSLMDVLASIVSYWGVRHALRPADLSHRFGHGKAEPLAALAQAAFVVGSAFFLLFEAGSRLVRPQQISQSYAAIAVMVASMVLTLGLLLFQRYVIRRTGSLAVGADHLHYRGDLAMNLAVILAIALTGWTGWPYFDPLFALGIGIGLMASAARIVRHSLDMLMDRELPESERQRIEALVLEHPATLGLHDLRTRNSGDRIFIELHLELDPKLTLAAAHDIADAIEQRLLTAFGQAEILIHQEPAGLDDDRLDHRIAP
jgi:ferrous-iron efflux pump FieF